MATNTSMESAPQVANNEQPKPPSSQSAMDTPEAPDSAADSAATHQVLRDEASFIHDVAQFYNHTDLADVTLRVGDVTYPTHRFVLAKSSDVFRSMLYDEAWSDNQKDEMALSESPECTAVFDRFLRYLYTAEIVIGIDSAVGILCLADKYQVTSLKDLCTRYMTDNSRSPRVRNALAWYPWAKALHLESLARQCTRTIAWNFDAIVAMPDWLGMDADFVADMTGSSELVVSNEWSVWEALSAWLLLESRRTEALEDNAKRLLRLVRFPQMHVSQLKRLEGCELAAEPGCQSLLHNMLGAAYRFRALCPAQGSLDISFSDDITYMPRDYIDLVVDRVRMQNTLRFGIQVDVKMYRGPLPSETRDADWKINYRKQNDVWSLQVYAHETAMTGNEARVEASVIVYDESDRIIQVHREPTFACTRGSAMNVSVTIEQPDLAHHMAVLLKPVPS